MIHAIWNLTIDLWLNIEEVETLMRSYFGSVIIRYPTCCRGVIIRSPTCCGGVIIRSPTCCRGVILRSPTCCRGVIIRLATCCWYVHIYRQSLHGDWWQRCLLQILSLHWCARVITVLNLIKLINKYVYLLLNIVHHLTCM